MSPWRRGLPSTTLVSTRSTTYVCHTSKIQLCVLPLPLQPPPLRVPSGGRCVHSPSFRQAQTWRGGDAPCLLCEPLLGAAPAVGQQGERGAVSGSAAPNWVSLPAPWSGRSQQPASRGRGHVQGSPGQRRLRISGDWVSHHVCDCMDSLNMCVVFSTYSSPQNITNIFNLSQMTVT